MTLRTVISCLFRLGWFGILCFAFFEQNKVNSRIPPEFNRTLKFGGRYVFLTHLNQLVSKISFLLLALSSFEIVSKNKSSVFWATTSLPLSFIVPILYWGMYSINPDLVRRKETVEFIPRYLEFLLHTAVLPATLIEAFLGGHEIQMSKNMKICFGIVCAYISWLMVCFCVTGDWPYGFVAKLGVIPSLFILVPAYMAVAAVGMGVSRKIAKICPKTNCSSTDLNQNRIKKSQ